MSNKKGALLINTGLLLLISAVALTGYNIYDGRMAEMASQNAASQLNETIVDVRRGETDENVIPDYILNPDMDMPTKNIDGWEYIGVVDVPDLGLSLPVIESYSRQAIKVAPACYGGSAYKDNFIICAHNYAAHFGKIGRLAEGDTVDFTDVDGNVFNYEVIEKETLEHSDREGLFGGDWDLTLVSCTPSGQARMTVRCKRI